MALGLGTIAYVVLLLINSLAILSESRFLLPLGLISSSSNNQSNQQQFNNYNNYQQQSNQDNDQNSIKNRAIELISAIRTLMRSILIHSFTLSTIITRTNTLQSNSSINSN